MLLSVAVFLSSCGTASLAERLEYDFDEGTNQYRLVMAIPDEIFKELHQRDEQGNSLRTFLYRDGSELFIACREQTYQPALAINRDATVMESLANFTGPLGEGTNANGTKWKRAVKSGFIVGYDFVEPARVKQYEKALQSIRIKK